MTATITSFSDLRQPKSNRPCTSKSSSNNENCNDKLPKKCENYNDQQQKNNNKNSLNSPFIVSYKHTFQDINKLYLQYTQHILQFLQICHEATQTLHADELQGTLIFEILVEWSEREIGF